MKQGAMIFLVGICLAASADTVKSGLQVGDPVPAYNPQHVAGPLKGTRQCFV